MRVLVCAGAIVLASCGGGGTAAATGGAQRAAEDLGSTVAAGDLLASLSPKDFQLRVTQATAALQQARARLGLPVEGTDGTVDVEQTSLVRQARAVLDQARLTSRRAATMVKDGIHHARQS